MRFTIAALATLAATVMACEPASNFKVTFYGFPDNSPPGNKVEFNCGGRNGHAAGVGSYAEPLTMAAEKGRFEQCEIVYSPYLKKYLRMEDSCATCSGDWIDVWTGDFDSNGGDALLKCQNTLTGADSGAHTVIRTPPQGLDVDIIPLFTKGTCNSVNTYLSNTANGSCTGGSGVTVPSTGTGATPVASVVPAVPSSSSTSGRGGRRGRKGRKSE